LSFIPFGLGRISKMGFEQVSTMNEVFDITLRAANGQERNQLQWLPTPAARQELYERWRKRGIEVTDEKEII
jgi:hypothetical protein